VCYCVSEEIQAKNRKDIIQEDIQPGSKIINIVSYRTISVYLFVKPELDMKHMVKYDGCYFYLY